MQDLLLSRGAHSLANSPFISSGIHTWERLQSLKEEVSLDLLGEGSLCKTEIVGLREGEESKANAWDIGWLHRAQLEGRLRDVIDAQDRLLNGTYGKCIECGEAIARGRLMADPVANLCLQCQKLVERDHRFCTL